MDERNHHQHHRREEEEEEEEENGSESGDYTSEDEGTEDYRRGGYHAVRIGDAFKSGRYVVQSKLGWGHFSTVWLAWDTLMSRYVALKVQKSAQHYTEAAMDEITILQQIAGGDPEDKKCVVKLLDHFKHSGPNGQHVCMVFEYLGDNLLTLIKYSDYHGLPIQRVKEICFHILVGLDYLHRQLSIIHTDLKPENILLLSTIDPSKDPTKSGVPLILPNSMNKTLSDSGIAKDVKPSNGDLTKNQKKKIKRKAKRAAHGCVSKEASEETETDPETSVGAGTSNSNVGSVESQPDASVSESTLSNADGTGQGNQGHKRGSRSARQKLLASVDLKCKLVDFGNACWTYKQFTNDIQTRQYRCPEVILGSKYSTSADLWSFACICFELATGDVLFDPHSGDNFDRDEVWIRCFSQSRFCLLNGAQALIPTDVARKRNNDPMRKQAIIILHLKSIAIAVTTTDKILNALANQIVAEKNLPEALNMAAMVGDVYLLWNSSVSEQLLDNAAAAVSLTQSISWSVRPPKKKAGEVTLWMWFNIVKLSVFQLGV
ncbi:ser/arg-rich protein kinase 4 [Actinidia rufa]|uniref:non-specific serine/threonine protein kinase n=1 Tax=Actinidia rufa TaxID=165716 RepID=A0A7J0F449_9ERIC|nr:ser/arg-rich protein kinase 4 [Actinidia rufa]